NGRSRLSPTRDRARTAIGGGPVIELTDKNECGGRRPRAAAAPVKGDRPAETKKGWVDENLALGLLCHPQRHKNAPPRDRHRDAITVHEWLAREKEQRAVRVERALEDA